MSWQDQVPGAFRVQDVIFGVHPLDEARAKEAIEAAKAAGAAFSEFEKEIVWHCYQKVTASGMLQEHIEKQVARAKKLWG
jgi:ABC-type sugar transport system substrate-binding protein